MGNAESIAIFFSFSLGQRTLGSNFMGMPKAPPNKRKLVGINRTPPHMTALFSVLVGLLPDTTGTDTNGIVRKKRLVYPLNFGKMLVIDNMSPFKVG